MGRAYSVIVWGEDAAAREAAAGLAELGFTVTTHGPSNPTANADDENDGVVSFAPAPAALTEGRVHVAVGDHGDGADGGLQGHVHPIQLAARFRAQARLRVLEQTARLRAMDALDAGAPPAPSASSSEEPSILFVGAPCPAYLRLRFAMDQAGVETVAALSTFNAFDYLHERTFDAVVLNADPDPDLAHTVCSAMRRNTRLYHTPAILLTRSAAYEEADEAFARGASDLLARDASNETIQARLTALTEERRRRRRAKALLEACRAPAFLDSHTDLFGAEFGERHLATLLREAGRQSETLTLVGLAAVAPPEAGGEHGFAALDQFASMLRHCVRAEDFAVRTGPGSFYLALPHTRASEADIVATRVAAIAECTAYEGHDPHRPFRLELHSVIREAEPGTDAARALAQLRPQSAPREAYA